MKITKISVLIPCFNEKDTIISVIEKVQNLDFIDKEIIIVDDGSTDGTKEILKKREVSNKFLNEIFFFHENNQGKGAAIQTAIKNISCEYAVIQDADLEYDPKEFIKFTNLINKFSVDVIIGSRFNYSDYIRSHNIANKFGNYILTLFFNLLYNTTFTDIYSCYLAFRRDILDVDKLKTNGFEQHAEILCKIVKKSDRFYEVPINYNGRSAKEGKKIKFYHFFIVIYRIFIEKF